MDDEEVISTLKNEMQVLIVFENINELMSNVYQSLEGARIAVNECTDLRLNSFRGTKDAILKYRNENNVKLCKQERDTLEKTMALNEQSEVLRKEISNKEYESKLVEEKINCKRIETSELEAKQNALLSEKNKVVENLERTQKAYALALAWYQNYLSMMISCCLKENRFDITFLHKKGQKQNHTFSFIKSGGSFLLSDGTEILTTVQLMARLCQERRKWLMNHNRLN